MISDESDFLVIGGGVIGISIARELKKRFHGGKISLIDKEPDCGLHASGRNSGVLHAGFYYSPDSLKARFTRDGNRRLTEYCREKHLKINPCGKLVVTQNERELPLLDALLERGNRNGVQLHSIDKKQAQDIEPRAKTFERALFSPTTSSVNPMEVMRSLKKDAIAEGISLHLGVAYVKRETSGVATTKGLFNSKFIVGAAGLYADQVARDFGFSKNYRILPFKGLYLYSDYPPGSLKTHIYPVPDPRYPFLGVHFTVTAEGETKIGPTAIPAFWREQYDGLSRFNLPEFSELAWRQLGLFLFSNFGFKRLALEEIRKYSRTRLIRLASSLLENIRQEDFKRWGKPGIRAQLMDLRNGQLEMDFVLEGDERSLHVLNAVSPAFTCALPIADHVCDQIEKLQK